MENTSQIVTKIYCECYCIPVPPLIPSLHRGNPPRQHSDKMNRYLLFTRSGKAFSVAAHFAEDAIAKVEAFARDRVSCWFLGQKMPRNVISLN